MTHSLKAWFSLTVLTAASSLWFTQLMLPAQAQTNPPRCEFEGQVFEPGDTVGPFICGPDGNWQRND